MKPFPKEERHHGTAFFPVGVYEQHQSPDVMIVDFHWHDEWEFLWLLDGRGQFQINNHRETLEAGQMMIVPSQVIHGGIPFAGQSCSFRAIVFHPRLLLGEAGDLLAAAYIEPFVWRHRHFPTFLSAQAHLTCKLRTLCNSLFHLCQRRQPYGYEILVKGQLFTAWALLLSQSPFSTQQISTRETQRQAKMRRILQYIQNHLTESLAEEDLAACLNFSKDYFCRFFKASMCMTPIEYIHRCRIKKAATYLQTHPELSIMEIAYACGFNNLSYFNLIFKRLLGYTPTEYKKRRG